METALQLGEAGLKIRDAVVLLDRQQGGRERLRRQGIDLVSVLTLEVLMNYLRYNDKVTAGQYSDTMEFLDAHRHLEDG